MHKMDEMPYNNVTCDNICVNPLLTVDPDGIVLTFYYTLVIVFDFANNEDSGEMLCYAAFHLGLL